MQRLEMCTEERRICSRVSPDRLDVGTLFHPGAMRIQTWRVIQRVPIEEARANTSNNRQVEDCSNVRQGKSLAIGELLKIGQFRKRRYCLVDAFFEFADGSDSPCTPTELSH